MTGRNSVHYSYDVSYWCWFASEEAKIYCYNCKSSNAVVCSYLILAYTVRLAILIFGRIGTKWLFFFTFIEECCVVIEEELANRISYQIWYKRRLKGKFGGGVEIRCDTRKGVIDRSEHFSFLKIDSWKVFLDIMERAWYFGDWIIFEFICVRLVMKLIQ